VVCRKSQHTNQYGAITTEKQAVKKQVRNTIITKKQSNNEHFKCRKSFH